MSATTMLQKESLTFDKPTVQDGSKMWELAKKLGLDLNSSYKYLMMSEYFSETCVVVKEEGELVGFITAFILPEKDDTVFVWQVGVDSSQRGRGLASRMLDELIERNACQEVKYLEATVTPSNDASQKLFRRLARTNETACHVSECFSEDLFPGDNHEPELSFKIGPIFR
ncbi:diaminobutyrate acetyltransferase [Salicibibacter halophilus]|uniref:L-2,4-diaminobutyric acid acetyltransferase n=1 Tax=Salicibibacter halophilus TaxID=2502791 RepID=A0A514LMI1_9BACI|nr:diaminobutyrate acetyltransferase [Salicibibacter halophilus]QDI92745.1 diaminobutyrate acetyltransferase [Salicibibacter halophilus]